VDQWLQLDFHKWPCLHLISGGELFILFSVAVSCQASCCFRIQEMKKRATLEGRARA
jgi:hypothetical protein